MDLANYAIMTILEQKEGGITMWRRELLQNKLYAVLLILYTLPVMFLDGDDCRPDVLRKRKLDSGRLL